MTDHDPIAILDAALDAAAVTTCRRENDPWPDGQDIFRELAAAGYTVVPLAEIDPMTALPAGAEARRPAKP